MSGALSILNIFSNNRSFQNQSSIAAGAAAGTNVGKQAAAGAVTAKAATAGAKACAEAVPVVETATDPITFGGVTFDDNKCAGRNVKNGRYYVEFSNGISVNYPEQDKKNMATIDIGSSTIFYDTRTTVNRCRDIFVTGSDKRNDLIVLEGCTKSSAGGSHNCDSGDRDKIVLRDDNDRYYTYKSSGNEVWLDSEDACLDHDKKIVADSESRGFSLHKEGASEVNFK